MLLSVKHKFAFLCVPKCGSTSVERALKPYADARLAGHPSLKHVSARKFHSHIRPLLHKADPAGEIETFCIIREPIDWLRSWYQYRSRAQLADRSHPQHLHHTGGLTFRDFAEAYLNPEQPEFARLGSQYEFVTLGNGTIGVNRIFRLDQMDSLAAFLSSKTGKEIRIPRANRSGGKGGGAGLGRWLRRGESAGPRGQEAAEIASLPEALLARLRTRFAPDLALYESLRDQAPAGVLRHNNG